MRTLRRLTHRLGYRGWTLDYYTARRFVLILLANFCLFNFLYILIDGLANLEKFYRNSDGFFDLLGMSSAYYFYTIPELNCRVLGPVTTMTSAMFTVTIIQRSNEIVPALASGISLRRLTFPVVMGSAVVAGASFAIQELWIPSNRQEIQTAKGFDEDKSVHHPVYLDSPNDIVIASKKYFPHRYEAEGMLILGPSFILNATSARWLPDEEDWLLSKLEYQKFDEDGILVPQVVPGTDDEKALWLSLESAQLNGLLGDKVDTGLHILMKPHDLENDSGSDLYSTLEELRAKMKTVPDVHRLRTKYYARLSDPFHHLVLVLLGIPVILWQGSRNVFLSALVAVMLGAAYYTLQGVAIYFGNESHLDPHTAAWLIPSVFGSLGLTLFAHMRT